MKLSEWVTSIEAGEPEPLNRVSVKAMFSPPGDLIKNIAEALIEQASGTEGDLLSKSLQETLLYWTGIDLEMDYAEMSTRLARFLASRGKSALIEQFLALCIFNFVWFQVSDAFQATARTTNWFKKDMDSVERICQRIVASTWRSYESRQLDTVLAEKLIRSIEQQLRGDSGLQAVQTKSKKD